MTLLETKPYIEMFAYLAAGVFFLYKLLTGYLMTNLSVAMSSSRQPATAEKDYLVISVTLAKGDRGSVDLHDCQVKVAWTGKQLAKSLIGTDRRSKKTEYFDKSKRNTVNWELRSISQPFLHLTPDETCHFSTYFEVPSGEICEVETAILAMKRAGFRVGQWRASLISLPIAKIAK